MNQQRRLSALALNEYTDRDGKPQTKWTRIGVAFENRDGSMTIELHALPVATGNPPRTRIQIREDEDREREGDRRDRR